MELLLDTFRARTTKLWPFEAAGALGIAVATKAPRGLGGLPKQKCLGSPLEGQHRGLPTTPESTIGEGGLPSHSQVSRCDLRESRGGVAYVGASP